VGKRFEGVGSVHPFSVLNPVIYRRMEIEVSLKVRVRNSGFFNRILFSFTLELVLNSVF
jgi:hypothetical protein